MRFTRFWQRVLASLIGGVLLAASFPPYDLVWLAPPGLALLTVSWHGARVREGLLLGFVSGLVFFGVHISWINVVGDDAWALLAVYCAMWIGLVGGGVAGTSKLRWWPAVVPLLWVAEEAGRDRIPLGGFPWGRLASGQTATLLTSYAALAGAPAVTFAIALIGALLGWVALAFRVAAPRLVVGSLVTIILACTLGGLIPRPIDGQTGPNGEPAYLTVAVVQGSVPHLGLSVGNDSLQVLRNHVRVTEQLASQVKSRTAAQPDLVVWPESSSDIDPFEDQVTRNLIQTAANDIKAPILLGAVINDVTDPTHVLNAGIVWGPSGSANAGPGQFYVKRQLVPFGEWVPFRSLLTPYFTKLVMIPRDFAPGKATGVLQVGPARIGDVICFEVAYDNMVRDAVTGANTTGELAGLGGRLLTVQTNNATYGGTTQLSQQVAMSQLRAVEHGRTVLVAATSGITAVVAPNGQIMQQLPENVPGVIVAKIPLRDDLTIADQVGEWPEWIGTALGLLALLLAVRLHYRNRVYSRGSQDPAVGSPDTAIVQEPVP
jgi:apolipoprotein N-acyltransferase